MALRDEQRNSTQEAIELALQPISVRLPPFHAITLYCKPRLTCSVTRAYHLCHVARGVNLCVPNSVPTSESRTSCGCQRAL